LVEKKDNVILSILKIVDDDTGIWAGDEFDFALTYVYREHYEKNPEAAKRLADELRSVADMIERRSKE